PRWPPQLAHVTSVRSIPKVRSVSSSIAPSSAGAKNAGQPQPESYFVSDSNRVVPHPAQTYVPGSNTWSYSPLNARSVPFSRRTRYCSGLSSARHSASVFWIFVIPFSLRAGENVSGGRDPPSCYHSENERARAAGSPRPPHLRRPDARHPARVARPDDRGDGAADDRRRPGRAPAPLMGGHGVPARLDDHGTAVREVRRPLRPQADPAGRDRHLPDRLDPLRARAEHDGADCVPRPPGSR